MRRARATLLLLVAALGCRDPSGGGAPPPAVSLDLAGYLPVAQRSSLVASARPPPHSESPWPGAIAQPAGTAITYYFPLPEEARISGRARNLGPPGSPWPAARISLRDEDGRTLERSVPPPDSLDPEGLDSVAFAWELGALAGHLAAVRLEVSPAEASGIALEWNDLHIEGAARPERAADLDALRGRYDVLLVLFDSLRADRLQPYGASEVRTPNLARLAAEGVTFERAFTNASWTSPSVASIFTSLYPTEHGIGAGPMSKEGRSALSPDLPYLPEILSRAGYAALAILNNPMANAELGFGRGFDGGVHSYSDKLRTSQDFPVPEAQADHVWDHYVEPFLERAGGKRSFVFVHELDPHFPYEPPAPYDSLYDPHYEGHVTTLANFAEVVRINENPALLDARERRHVNALYDGEVTFMDAYLGRLLERLERSGRAERTVVVFTSDHGELLGENDGFGHGPFVTEEALHVPLLVRLPGVLEEGRRVSDPVELVDLAPTLLDLLRVPAPPDMRGRSLLPLLAGGERLGPTRPLYARGHLDQNWSRDVLRFGDWKLVRFNAEVEPGAADRYLLHDLGADPGERVDLFTERPVVAGALRQMLAWRQRLDAAGPHAGSRARAPAPTPEVLEQLRELGYVD